MTKTLEATYDGETLRPDEPLDLKPNTRVRVTIEMPVESEKKQGDISRFFGAWESGNPNSGDNEQIDADLAREYSATHDED